MREYQRRFVKSLLTAILIHLIFAVCLGLFGFSFERKEPHILEVTLVGGSPAPAQDVTEPEPIIQRPDDIVDKKLKPQEKPKQPVEKKASTNKPSGPAPKYTSETGTGDGSGNNEKGKGSGEGGAQKGVPVTPPRLISSVEPRYPESARSNNIEGTTAVKMLVNAGGKVEQAYTVQSSGNAALDSAAVDVVYRWKFSPAKDAYGQQAPCYITIPITFRLRK